MAVTFCVKTITVARFLPITVVCSVSIICYLTRLTFNQTGPSTAVTSLPICIRTGMDIFSLKVNLKLRIRVASPSFDCNIPNLKAAIL